jgi:hypothetical protein
VVTERSWGLLAAIITYSHSFSGYGSEHPPTQVAGVQPLAHYNFNKCYYLRSSDIRNIDHGNHVSLIPIGFGAGKVTLLRSGIVMNLYGQRVADNGRSSLPPRFSFPIGPN